MGNEETLSGFPVKQTVPALVSGALNCYHVITIGLTIDTFASDGT